MCIKLLPIFDQEAKPPENAYITFCIDGKRFELSCHPDIRTLTRVDNPNTLEADRGEWRQIKDIEVWKMLCALASYSGFKLSRQQLAEITKNPAHKETGYTTNLNNDITQIFKKLGLEEAPAPSPSKDGYFLRCDEVADAAINEKLVIADDSYLDLRNYTIHNQQSTTGKTQALLTPIESVIFMHLLRHKNEYQSATTLLDLYNNDPDNPTLESTINSHILNIRNALRTIGLDNLIIGKRGSGYKISSQEPEFQEPPVHIGQDTNVILRKREKTLQNNASGTKVDLTPTEYMLLEQFLTKKAVYYPEDKKKRNSQMVFICRLKNRLKIVGIDPNCITTIHGSHYQFDPQKAVLLPTPEEPALQ